MKKHLINTTIAFCLTLLISSCELFFSSRTDNSVKNNVIISLGAGNGRAAFTAPSSLPPFSEVTIWVYDEGPHEPGRHNPPLSITRTGSGPWSLYVPPGGPYSISLDAKGASGSFIDAIRGESESNEIYIEDGKTTEVSIAVSIANNKFIVPVYKPMGLGGSPFQSLQFASDLSGSVPDFASGIHPWPDNSNYYMEFDEYGRLFVSNQSTNDIRLYSSLTDYEIIPFTSYGISSPGDIAYDKNEKRLLIVDANSNTIHAYTGTGTGQGINLGATFSTGGKSIAYQTINSGLNYLYVADDSKIAMYQVGTDGTTLTLQGSFTTANLLAVITELSVLTVSTLPPPFINDIYAIQGGTDVYIALQYEVDMTGTAYATNSGRNTANQGVLICISYSAFTGNSLTNSSYTEVLDSKIAINDRLVRKPEARDTGPLFSPGKFLGHSSFDTLYVLDSGDYSDGSDPGNVSQFQRVVQVSASAYGSSEIEDSGFYQDTW